MRGTCSATFARLAAALLALAPGAGAVPQYDPAAREPVPVVRGALVLWGGSEAPAAEVLDAFAALAGQGPIALVGAPADADWFEGGVRVAGDVLPARLSEFGAAWFHGDAWGDGTEALWRALGDALRAGSVFGGSGAFARAAGEHGLLPQAVVTTGFEPPEEGEASVLDGPLAARPGAVGYGIGPGTALVYRGRRVSARGASSVWAVLPPALEAAVVPRARRVEEVRGRRVLDHVALARAAVVRALAPFPPARVPDPVVVGGTLILAGGGALPDALLRRFVELAGGPDAPIVYVPCSEAESIAREPGFVSVLRRAGAHNVTWLHTKDRERADSDRAFLAPLVEAGGVWFGGGRQWNLVDSYQHTQAHFLMQEVLERGGVIAGSSAGASIQAQYMARGDPLGNTNIIAEGYEEGLGFLPGCAVDQHFTERQRQADMTLLVDTYPTLLGIGIDEGVALVVRAGVGEVFAPGSPGGVHFYDRRLPVEPGGKDHLSLGDGVRFDLVRRRTLE